MYRVVKNVFWCIFAYFQTTRNMGSKMMLFIVCCGNVLVLMHLRILRDHQNQVCLKIFFNVQTTRIKFLKKKFFNVVENVFFCICAYSQTTRIKFFKTIFFNVWSGYKRVFTHLRILPNNQNQVLKKDIF